MITRTFLRSAGRLAPSSKIVFSQTCSRCARLTYWRQPQSSTYRPNTLIRASGFHATTYRNAQSPTADQLMENLNDLYATAKDEFEIAAEETEKKTVYAQDDRDAAREALTVLKEALERAVKESPPEVAKEVTGRVGQRIRELENAVIAMEESAMEE